MWIGRCRICPLLLSLRGLGASVDASAYENLRSSDGAWALVMIGGVGVTFHADRVAYTGPGHFLAVGIDPAMGIGIRGSALDTLTALDHALGTQTR